MFRYSRVLLGGFVFLSIFSFPNLLKSEFNSSDSDSVVSLSDADSSLIIKIPLDLLKALPKYQTALHLQYQKHKEELEKNKEKPVPNKPSQKPSRPKQKEKIKALLEELDPDYFNLFKAVMGEEVDLAETRAIASFELTKPVYFKMTTDMSDANGGVELDQSTATNFSVDEVLPLKLNLKNGSTLILRSDVDVALKQGDIINVIGHGNKIYITKEFDFNGALYFDIDADLEIIFSKSSATISFKPGMQIDLEGGDVFKVHGDGSIILNDESIINFKNFNNKPSFILEDSATLYFSGKTLFKGTGIFKVLDEAALNFDASSGGTLIVGDSLNDYFEFAVSDNSVLNIKGNVDTNSYGYLYFANGHTTFSVNNGGTVIIGNHGKLAVNQTQGDQLARGTFNGFNFVPTAQFYLQPGGELSIAPNINEYNPGVGNNFMIWNADSTVFFGGADSLGNVGIVRYVSPNSSFGFAGQMVLSSGNFVTNGISTENLARTLINRSSVLVTAIQFLDANNVGWIRLKNGKTIQMQSGDVIVEEEPDGSVLGRDSLGRSILYTLDGRREIFINTGICHH